MSNREIKDDYDVQVEEQELFLADMEDEDPDRAILKEVGMDLNDVDE